MASKKINYFVGFDAVSWFTLVMKHRKLISRSNWPTVATLSGISLINSMLKWPEILLWGRRIAGVELPQSPIFILGHWRCGATLLHEFFACDRRCSYPTSYQCFAPHHFLLTEHLFTGTLVSVMERVIGYRPTRSQDNMNISYQSPQEDEFALTFLGAGSPYLTRMFPSKSEEFLRYTDIEALSEQERTVWKHRLLFFLRKMTLNKQRGHLVLKSLAHTYRIKIMLELFPDARFVHIRRDPYTVFVSTRYAFETFLRSGSLESVDECDVKEWVFESGLSLYKRLEETHVLIPSGHFYEILYEDLVQDPVGVMHTLYTYLELDKFETELLPGLETFLSRVSPYNTNRYHLPPDLRDEIRWRWNPIIEQYHSYRSSA